MTDKQDKFNKKLVWFLLKLLIALPLSSSLRETLGEDIIKLSELL